MAQKDRLTLGVVTVATPSLTLGGLTNLSDPTGTNIIKPRSASVDPEFIGVMSSRPQINFTSMSVAEILTALGQDGLETTTFKAIYQRIVPYGARQSTAAQSTSYAKAYLLPRTVTASQEETATITCEAKAISEDGSDPTTMSSAASLPAGAAVDEAFTMGPVSINGSSYDLQSGSLDFGIAEEIEASEGEAYPTFAAIGVRDTMFTFGSKTAYTQVDLGITGEELTSFSWYLRKILANGVRVPEGTAEHIKFTATGYVHIGEEAATPNSRLETSIICIPKGPITIDASSAIT